MSGATPRPWFVVPPPWGDRSYAVAGSEDPHGRRPVLLAVDALACDPDDDNPDPDAQGREDLTFAVLAANAHDRIIAALDEIREIAEDYADGAPDASAEEKAWMRVLAAAERGMNR